MKAKKFGIFRSVAAKLSHFFFTSEASISPDYKSKIFVKEK